MQYIVQKRRYRLLPFLLLAVAVGLLTFVSRDSLAVDDDGLLELEGNIEDSPAGGVPDWGSIFVDSNSDGIITDGTSGTPDEINEPAVTDTVVFLRDDLSQRGPVDRTIFAESNKNDDPTVTWNWDSGNSPPKDDLSNVYALDTTAGAGATFPTVAGDDILYVGIERIEAGGDSHIDIELNQAAIGLDEDIPCNDPGQDVTPCSFTGEKRPGDLVFSFDYTIGGGIGTIVIHERQDVNGTPADLLDDVYVDIATFLASTSNCTSGVGTSPPLDAMCAFLNTSNLTGIAGTGSWDNFDRHGAVVELIETNGFTEFGVNLSQLGVTGCFSTITGKTRSSQSFNAELKDFVLGRFQRCGSTIRTEIHDAAHNDITGTTVITGTQVHDAAFLRVSGPSGAPNAGGTVTIHQFSTTNCTGDPVLNTVRSVNQAVNTTVRYETAAIAAPSGGLSYLAEYSGDAVNGYPRVSMPITACEVLLAANPTTKLFKFATVVTTATYTYKETNDGDVPITSVNVTDPDCTPVRGLNSDAPGDNDNILEPAGPGGSPPAETWVFTCVKNITAGITNTAKATGTITIGGVTKTIRVCTEAELSNPPAGVQCDQDEQDSVTISAPSTVTENPPNPP